MTQPSETARAFVRYVREQADWRDGKAQEYPDDGRNAASAAALRSLADLIERRDNSADMRFYHLTFVVFDDGYDCRFAPLEDMARAVSRYGFDPFIREDGSAEQVATEDDHDALLDHLASLVLWGHEREVDSLLDDVADDQ